MVGGGKPGCIVRRPYHQRGDCLRETAGVLECRPPVSCRVDTVTNGRAPLFPIDEAPKRRPGVMRVPALSPPPHFHLIYAFLSMGDLFRDLFALGYAYPLAAGARQELLRTSNGQ